MAHTGDRRAGLAALVAGLALAASAHAAAQAQDESAEPEEAAETAPAAEPVAWPAEPEPETLATVPVTESAPADSAAPGATELDDIVVTARKRLESLQDVPVAVTAFTRKQIEQRGYENLEDIAAKTPGFTFEPYVSGGAHSSPVVRGLAQTFINNRTQNVSFFLDGIFLQRQSMINLGMIDMDRVEVVKGPQNALYGRNAFAGAVNYETQQPEETVQGYLSYGAGDNDRRQLRASVSGPIPGFDALSGKLTLGTNSYDGHTRNNHPMANADPPGPNARGNLGGVEDETYSASLVYEPFDGLRTRVSYYYGDMIHEAHPGYSISGVNAQRFGLRFPDQNDLNCNFTSVPDIQPQPAYIHEGFSAWCGELPKYASDVGERAVDGIVIDPRPIGSTSSTHLVTFLTDYDVNDDITLHYLFGWTQHQSYTDGGASDEDPVRGRSYNINALRTSLGDPEKWNPDNYIFINTTSSRPNSEVKTMTHELRLDWQVRKGLETSFGLYYAPIKDEEWTELYLNDLCNADNEENRQNCNEPLRTPNTIAERTNNTGVIPFDQAVRQHGGRRGEWLRFDETITAAFTSMTYYYRDLEMTLEGRYSVEKKIVDRLADSFMLAPGQTVSYCGDPRVQPPCDAPGSSISSAIIVAHDETTFRDFTPRGILSWKYAPDRMVYGSLAQGLKNGGFNNANSPGELTYGAETNWTYELGTKNRLLDRALALNGSVFYIDWTDLQVNTPPAASGAGFSTSDIITNVGGATNVGIELETVFQLADSFSLDFGGTWNDPKYKEGSTFSAAFPGRNQISCNDETCPSNGDIGGNQISRTSKVQYYLGANYSSYPFGWLLHARIDTDYRSRQYVEALNLGWVPDRQLLNASFNAVSPDQHWEIGAWGKNLTDEDYAASAIVIMVFNQYMVGKGPGRQFGVNLKYNF